MGRTVDYYFSPTSPWTYLGHARFAEMAQRHGAVIRVKPADLSKIFPICRWLSARLRPSFKR